ncbi:MAG: IS1634 family transposase [Deltaproteobacteria bacterium]|nr:IS1634 family transposase [Deltaproteobacteria bacterium]
MAITIDRKRIKGGTYYYARECRRVDGKPKIVWQKYLGKAERIVAAVTGEPSPPALKEVLVSEFGAVAALYRLAQRLDLVGLIDAAVAKREQGLSVGHYMLVAALNRCVAPCSKQRIGDWFEGTPLVRWLPARKSHLSSKRFWDNMGHLTVDRINAIEQAVSERVVAEFGVDTHCLLFDATNFFTFIDSFNDRSTLAQRGHSKEGREDLRIVGLALLVSMDFHIPLFHDTYAGNRNDAKEFGSVTGRLMERYKALTGAVEEITVVFDKGNNSDANLELLDRTEYHFVGSLKLNQCPELLTVPVSTYARLRHPRLPGVRVLRTCKKVFGKERTVVVAYNEQLYLSQSLSLQMEVRKRTRHLEALSRSLGQWRDSGRRGGRKPTVASVREKVAELLKGQYVKDVVRVQVEEVDGLPALSYQVDLDAMHHLSAEKLGKTILFTDNEGWNSEDIVLAYRGQAGVESAFRTMKDPQFVSWSPMFHWTDDRVRVHAFYCVLALLLASLLNRELHRAGLDLSIPEMLRELGGIREMAFVDPDAASAHPVRVGVSRLSPLQARLLDALDLRKDLVTAR